mmetsp:Transcript_24070/g.42877  ORF Transcript_24070/g.42877 Transcript_24070/m.42877 type:complete len:91 (-) Transcript_24070:16-288(-)|eukprot:CAMPEP_0205911562 /NCGR_PEP_ID=MMETSP1325-20131115/5236_1 /ASSEMBLY_ACC=CAM_ASM_000708 /TAXON_ID=236786 /ORGANISM="Florenciella sp., Strain RCC1007" /LENGTH=90 /DNA_ID=CAMNT_0053278111 /DNA_START=52 /DNA_END=324 /DNA_ORIENTATION=-
MKLSLTIALLALTSVSASFFSAPSMVKPSYEYLDRKPRDDCDMDHNLQSNPETRAEAVMLSPFWAPPANWPANERQRRSDSSSGSANRKR